MTRYYSRIAPNKDIYILIFQKPEVQQFNYGHGYIGGDLNEDGVVDYSEGAYEMYQTDNYISAPPGDRKYSYLLELDNYHAGVKVFNIRYRFLYLKHSCPIIKYWEN